ncbi:MAG: PEP-CTERM sorting domain-containing protein [Planctomycetaceae bacterium]|nr:PEP-CTERM sorting domain-containing protein [Planctomycetaceae bacterium]
MKVSLRLVCCCIITLSSSLFATAGFQLTAINLGDGKVAIGYSGADSLNVPVGIALNATLTNGATFTSLVSASSYFPIYPSTIMMDMSGVVTSWGTPVSPVGYPGVYGSLGTNAITLEMAADILCSEAGYDDYLPELDLNYDGFVDLLDLRVVVENWLINGDFSAGDINLDWIVNLLDLGMYANSNSIPLDLSDLVVLQIDLNGATETTLNISTETTYRGGIVFADGVVGAASVSLVIPEPTTVLLLTLGGLLLRKK